MPEVAGLVWNILPVVPDWEPVNAKPGVGLDAVEVKTRFGKIVRIGTDDPKGLVRALSTAVEKARGEAHE